jgi:glycosyltransferase involved in cell wall biosynthesis
VKLLFINKFFFLKGGAETVFFQERQHFLDKGHQVIDFSMCHENNHPSPYSSYFIPHVDYHKEAGIGEKLKKALSFIHSAPAVEKLQELVHEYRPEIAHLHNIYHQLTPSIIPVLRKNGVKVVLTAHDSKLTCPSYLSLAKDGICTKCQGHAFWHPLTSHCQGDYLGEALFSAEAYFHQWKRSYDGVDCFISPSEFLAGLIDRRVPREKIRVLKNGIDPDHYRPVERRGDYGLFFGRLSREKGAQVLLDAYEGCENEFSLKVVGTGPLEDRLKGQNDAVEFLGYKSGQELMGIIAKAAFVVVPSMCYENCSMTILEAMALGVPVVASRIGGIPEQIDDGESGFLFEMGNHLELREKMRQLAQQPVLRDAMGSAARKKLIEEYSLARHMTELESLYNELIKS